MNVLSANQQLGMIPRDESGIEIKYDSKKINTYKIVKDGDYVIHLRSFQGGFAFSSLDGICSPAYTILRPNSKFLCYSFLKEYFVSSRFIKSLKLVTFGLRDGKSIDVDLWLQTEFRIPSLNEQEKIIVFINTIQKKINIIKDKLNVLKKYKEGIKKYVIKDTIKYWKTGIGNAICLSSYLTEVNEYCANDGSYQHVTLSTDGISNKSERYDRDFLVKDENKKYKITHLNQLCYNPANLKFGVICLNKFGDGIFSPIYNTYNINGINEDYLELILTSIDFRKYSLKFQQGTVYERMAVSSEDFCNIKIVVADKLIQNKISMLSNYLNKKISKLEDELTNLNQLKSNLLNNMFI